MIKKLAVISSFILIPVIILITPSLLIQINNIDCKNQYGVCSSGVYDKSQTVRGQKLFFAGKKLKTLLDNEFLVKEYNLHFNFPDTYNVIVIERKPKYAVTNLTKSWFAQIDSEGYVVALVENTNLPYIVIDSEVPSTGNKLDAKMIFALDIMYFISNRYNVYSGSVANDVLSVAIKPFSNVIFPLEGDIEVLLGKLILVGASADSLILDNINFGNVANLDLRFKNPVVKL